MSKALIKIRNGLPAETPFLDAFKKKAVSNKALLSDIKRIEILIDEIHCHELLSKKERNSDK